MKIHDVIRTRRQTMGLTQEGLADRLGGRAPAVNKWEKGLNYPDITLLPSLARTLGVDLNTLLSFQEDLTQEEIGLFLNRVYETAQGEALAAAFDLARSKLREFPNSDLLAFSLAGLLEGILTLLPGGTEGERQTWQEEIDALYERCVSSADARVCEAATYTVASKCISRGELDRAQTLLDRLSDTHMDKRTLTASLRRKEGKIEEAWTILERDLFDRAHAIQTTLLHMIELAIEEGDKEAAHHFSDTAEAEGRVMGLTDYAVLSAPLQLAMAERNGPRALELLERLLHSLTVPWDLSESSLYRHLPTKNETGEAQSMLLKPLLDQLDLDPEAQFLKGVPGYQELVEQYQTWKG